MAVETPSEPAAALAGLDQLELAPPQQAKRHIAACAAERATVAQADGHQFVLYLDERVSRIDPFLQPVAGVCPNADAIAPALQSRQNAFRIPVRGRFFSTEILDRDVNAEFVRKLIDAGKGSGIGRRDYHLDSQALREFEHLPVVRSQPLDVIGHHLDVDFPKLVLEGRQFIWR